MNQLESIKLNAVDEDTGRLSLVVRRQVKEDIDDAALDRLPTMLKAYNVTLELSGVDNEILASEVNMDTAQFNRTKSGKNNFPLNKLNELLDACGNEVLLRWWARSRGYALVRLQSAVERELEAERQKNAELELKLKHFTEFMSQGK